MIIKSLPQPDGGEGASEWQGASGDGSPEESHSEHAGRCTRTQLGEPEPGRVCNTRRSPLSIAWRRSVDWAFAHGKHVGLPREIHGASCEGRTGASARGLDRVGEVSREHSNRRRNETGVGGAAARGSSEWTVGSPRRRLERWPGRIAWMNESGCSGGNLTNVLQRSAETLVAVFAVESPAEGNPASGCLALATCHFSPLAARSRWDATPLISRTATYGSVRVVVWEDRSAMGGPIPFCIYVLYYSNHCLYIIWDWLLPVNALRLSIKSTRSSISIGLTDSG